MGERISDQELLKWAGSADAIDQSTANITYIGYCKPGTTLTSASTWAIIKIEEGTADGTLIKYASGRFKYENVWTDRASLTYQFKKF